jgi:hypothetical protein
LVRVGAALVLAVAGVVASAGNAVASDWGGYADPSAAACGSNYVVSSTDVYASLMNGTWLYVGKLQVKWSYGCPGNYARFAAAGGIYPTAIGISIQAQASPYNKAGADEVNTVAWTRVIALAHSSDQVCAYVDVNLYAQGDLVHGSNVLCA